MTLTLGPAACATAALQVRQYRLLPGVEALAMHELADRAVVVVTGDLDRVVESVETDENVAAKTLAGRRAASRSLSRITQKIFHRIVDAATGAGPILQEAAGSVATVGVTPRCHECPEMIYLKVARGFTSYTTVLESRRCSSMKKARRWFGAFEGSWMSRMITGAISVYFFIFDCHISRDTQKYDEKNKKKKPRLDEIKETPVYPIRVKVIRCCASQHKIGRQARVVKTREIARNMA